MTKGVKVVSIHYKNLLGLTEFEIEPGAFTLIEGENAEGKTSVIEGIKSVIGGGSDATLIHNGTDEAEVVLVLEDGRRLVNSIGPDKSEAAVIHPEFGELNQPRTRIKKLSDIMATNPVEFLTAKKDRQLDLLLESIPMTVTADQFNGALELCKTEIDLSGHALKVISLIRDEIFGQRTGLNRDAKGKRATIEQLRQQLPPAPPEGNWSEAFEKLQREYRSLQSSHGTEIEAIKDTGTEDAARIKDQYQGYVDEVRAELDKQIADLRLKAQARIDGTLAKKEEKLNESAAEMGQLLEEEAGRYEPEALRLKEEGGKARANMDAEIRSESARKTIEQFEGEAAAIEAKSDRHTAALDNIDALKLSLLEKLPVKGLEIRDGEIYLNGIVFHRVNEAQKIKLAIEIAKIRARDREVRLVCIDGLEKFDPKTFEAFRKEAVRSGLQFVVTRVSSGPLSVTTEEAVNA